MCRPTPLLMQALNKWDEREGESEGEKEMTEKGDCLQKHVNVLSSWS